MKKFISFVTATVMSVSLFAVTIPSLDVSAADENYVIDFETGYDVGNVTKIAEAGQITTATAFSQIHNDTESKVEVVQESESNKAIKITKAKSGSGSFAGALVKLPAVINEGMYDFSFDLKIENHSVGFPTNYSFGSLTNYYSNGHSGSTAITKGLWTNYSKNIASFGDKTNILSKINDGQYHTFRCITNLDEGKACYYIDDKYVCTESNRDYANHVVGYICFSVCYDTNLNGSATGDGVYYIDNIKLKNVSNKIKFVTPANGAEGVAINSKVSVAYDYPYMGSADVEVLKNETALTADTDYTVTWNTDKSGFDIAFPSNMDKSVTYTVKVGDTVVTKFYTGGFAVDNYIVDLDFDEMTTGGLEVGWPGSVDEPTLRFVRGTDNTTNNANSKAEIAEESGIDGGTNKYLKITKDDTAMKSGALIKLPEALTSGVYEFSYDVRFDNHSRSLAGGGFGTTTSYWWNGSVSGQKTCTGGFDSYVTNVIQLAGKSLSWSSDEWQNVRTIIDLDNHTVTYYWKDKFWASKSTGQTDSAYNGILYLNFLLGHDATYNSGNAEGDGVYSVDNIVLKEIASDVTGYITAITDGEGTAATSVYGLKGKKACVNTAWISNVAYSDVKGLMAVYDDGMLVAVQVIDEPITLAKGKNTVNFELEIPETVSSAATAKIFMFGSMESVNPISKTINW